MKIYFAGSVRGNVADRSIFRELILHLSTFGQVLTEHLGSPDKGALDLGKTDAAIFAADADWLHAADVIVADVTAASTGVGYQLGVAASLGKKILCLFGGATAPSAMLSGNPNVALACYQTIEEARAAITEYLSPQRIFVLGPPGSGKGTQSQLLASRFGLVHISTGALLRARIATQSDALTKTLRGHVERGELVPAALMEQIVVERIAQADCLQQGYVLDGYPPSRADLANLERHGIAPTRVVVLTCADDVAISRQCGRQTDPVTGNIYHASTRPAPAEVAPRLVTRTTDVLPKATERVSRYNTECNDVQRWFSPHLVIALNAVGSVDEIANKIAAALLIPPPAPPSAYFAQQLKTAKRSQRFHAHIDAVSHQQVAVLVNKLLQRDPDAQVKIYPVRDLQLGRQHTDPQFASLYHRMKNFHSIDNATTEAFATIAMGDAPSLETLANAIDIAHQHQHLSPMVELEENLFEFRTNSDGKVSFDYDFGLTPDLPMPDLLRMRPQHILAPAYELHHGFDLPKDPAHTAALPISLDVLHRACAAADFHCGGWFVFAKASHWAYRSNEFSTATYDVARATVMRQAHALRRILHELTSETAIDQSSSLEKVHGIWCW